MIETTQAVRDQAFLPLSSDIPEGLTLRQYRLERSRQRGSLRYARRPWLSSPKSFPRGNSPTF